MGVHSQKFVISEPLDAGQPRTGRTEPESAASLPAVPAALLDRIFKHLNAEERAMALQYRLVPVAWLPHTILYADASASPLSRNSDAQWPVVARIQPHDFERAVHRNWRRSLARGAAYGLVVKAPIFSARAGLPGILQILPFAIATVLVCALLPLASVADIAGLIASSFFLGVIWLRLLAVSEKGEDEPDEPEMDDTRLPTYSVLVPLFRETRVLPQILHALQCLNYPTHKLDIKLILEETDTGMKRELARFKLPPQFEVLVVPAGTPQTKPRALNYALHFARGSLLTIYDAEDIPEPMQLRQAARRFANSPTSLACLQAELAFYNSNENWLTQQFTIEYAVLFKLMLPSLAKLNWPLPLGGTSNHFRIEILRAAGGWDAHNVTEDADLGIRLARLGYTVATLCSITYEEASSTPRNWLKQRARWLKGFLITWLVHMRRPRLLHEEIGTGGFLVMQASLLGVVASAVLHPLFILLLGWKLSHGGFATHGIQALFDCYFVALIPVSWLVMMLASARALNAKGIHGWTGSLFTVPIYWLCISAAGLLALWEFFRAPFHWNKTQHGVSRLMQASPQALKGVSISRSGSA